MRLILAHEHGPPKYVRDGIAVAEGSHSSVQYLLYSLRSKYNCGPRILFYSAKVVGLMKEIFPELVDAEARVTAVLKDEEMAFNKTLDKGLKEFNKVASGLGDTK